MISEGSCDTEDRRNDAENSDLTILLFLSNTFSLGDFFQKHKKNMSKTF